MLLFSLALAADLAAGSAAPVPTKIAQCEWVIFKPDGGGAQPLPALRIVAENGMDGFWIGESWMAPKPEEVPPQLSRLTGLGVSSPEAAWETVSKLKLTPALRMGIDIALWDLYGRSQGKPVADLLGPPKRNKVALYLAGIPDQTAEQNAALAVAAKRRGAHGFKIYTFLADRSPKRDPSNQEESAKWVEQDIEIATAVREAVGESFPLMFYNGNSYNLEQAIRVGKVLKELHYALYFDPMPENDRDSMANYIELKNVCQTPGCAPINPAEGTFAERLAWMERKAVNVNETDIFGGFTPCVQLVRACEKAGVPLDLHGGFMFDYYQFPLYAFVDDKTLPWIGFHLFKPKWTPAIAKDFPGSMPGDPKTPWIKRLQARPVDAEGYVHLNYEIPGMGVEYDWDWIKQHDVNARSPLGSGAPSSKPVVQNKEAREMLEMLRPYLDMEYNPAAGPDKDRPSIKENARKIAAALPAKLSVAGQGKKRILVLSYKTMGQLHVPGAGGLFTLLREAARKYGAFEITETYTSESIDAPTLAGFDAVVLNNISMTWGVQEDSLYNKLLPNYVKNGGGLVAVHAAALLFMDKPAAEYNRMLGGYVLRSKALHYEVHPKEAAGWNHCSPFAIKLMDPESPLAAALHGAPEKFTFLSCQLNGDKRLEWPVTIHVPLELADELYVISPDSNPDKTARCIVSVDPDKVPRQSFPGANDFSYSLAWVNSYGKGRVFYTQLGHNQAVFSIPGVARSVLEGLLYAAGDSSLLAGQATMPKGAEAPAARQVKIENPIFPYFYEKFEGSDQMLKELGYAPYQFLLAPIDFTNTPAFTYPEGWIHHVITRKGGHGIVAVVVRARDAKEESEAIAIFQQTADRLKGTGITLVIYPYVGTRVETAEQALTLAKKINRDNVGVTLQLIHEIKAGNSRRLPEIVGKAKGHLKLVVLCGADQPKEGDNPMQWEWSRLIRPLGDGDLDVYGLVKAVEESGYRGPYGLICWGLKQPSREHLTKSMATWKKYFEKMGEER